MTDVSLTEKPGTGSTEALTDEVKARIRNNIAAVRQALRGYENVTVMAATKTVPTSIINYAVSDCGITDIGENRVQELTDKYPSLSECPAKLHFIGTLQPNKVKYIVGKVSLIHSLDSLRLAAEISRRSLQHNTVSDVLCEINIGDEPSKSGVPESEVTELLRSLAHTDAVRPRGIMVIGPHCPCKDDYRPYFERTADLFRRLSAQGYFGDSPILSMGMSDNFDLAAEYGATIVRPGTAIFGARNYPAVT